MTKIKEITYPITVYSVSDNNCFPFGDGHLSSRTFDGPPQEHDYHQIKGKKFILGIDNYDEWTKHEYYLDKKEAKRIAIAFTKKRLKEYQEKVAKLKKQLKEIRAL